MMDQQTLVWSGFVSLVAPGEWTHSEEEGVISLYDPESGVGVLQISFARRSRPSLPTQEEAIEMVASFCKQRGWQVSRSEMAPTTIADSPAASLSVTDQAGAFWALWQVVDVERAMTITYTCDASDEQTEAQTLLAVIESLRWERTPTSNELPL